MRRCLDARSWSRAGGPPAALRVAPLIVLALLTGLACSGCEGRKKPPPGGAAKPTEGAAAPRAPVDAPLAPRVVWKTPYVGRLSPLAVVGEVVVVASRQRGDRASARRVAGFSTKDGRLLWQRPLRLRFFERGAELSSSFAMAGGVLALALTAERVEGIDPRTGAKLWQHRAAGGVVAVGDAFALARVDRVLLVSPRDGREIRQQLLEDPASGAPGNGLMDALQKGSRLGALPGGGLVLARRHGGALQALEGNTLAGRWLLGPDGALPDRPSRLAAGQRTLLVPRLLPRHQDHTQLKALGHEVDDAAGSRGATLWTVTVPGRVIAKRLFVTPTQVICVTRAANRQTLLVRVDRERGKLVDARPFPGPQYCFEGEGVIVCQRDKEIGAHDLDTLARRWRHVPGPHKTIHGVTRAGGVLVIEEGDHLVVKRFTDGAAAFEVPRRLENHPYRVVATLGVAGGRLVLAVRHLEGTPWGDRLLLVGLDLATGKPAYVHRLGRFPRPDPIRPGAVTEEEKLPGRLPILWIGASQDQPARVLALFEKAMQVVEAATGRSILMRGLPGEEGKPVRLLKEDGQAAIFQRGTTLFSLDLAGPRILWQASLFKARLLLATAHRALLERTVARGRALELVPPLAPDPLATGRALVEREGCALRQGSATLWLCQNATHLLVLDARKGRVLARLPIAAHVTFVSGLLLTTHPVREKSAAPWAWLGVDIATGRERWRLQEPADPAARKAAPLPPPFEEGQARPARWAAAQGGLFLVTDETGACVHGVHEETGLLAMRACFGALGGPPIAYEGKLLFTASPGAGKGGAGASSGGTAGGHALFVVDPVTGAARLVQAPETGKSLALGSAGARGHRLFMATQPIKGSFSHNEVLALDLR